jgi:ribosome recycling factor
MLNEIKTDAHTRMGKSIDSLKHDLTRIRTGRASTTLVDGIKVSYYGADTPLDQVASVSLADSRTIIITPWEKTLVAPIEKALMASDLGITPTTAGTVIRLNMPPLTEERRRDLAKLVGHEGENAKIAIRNIRRDANHHVKELLKDKQLTEDEASRAEADIQKLTDASIKDVDDVVKGKEAELMAV